MTALSLFGVYNKIMRLFAGLVFSLSATAALLPPSIGPFQRSTVSQPSLTDRPVWAEYGLKEAETAIYENDGKRLTASIFRMQDPTGALAVFDWQRPPDAKMSSAAKLASETKDGLTLVHGNYVLSFEGYKPSGPELQAVLGALNNVDTSSLPSLPQYLPTADLVPNSERYISGPASLAKFESAIPPSVAGFHIGAEAQTGSFRGPKGNATLAIFNYPTPQIAMERVGEFQKLPGAIAKRSGPLVAVAVSSPDADFAERLVGQVQYRAEVTRDEYVPTRRDNMGELLANIFALAGILVGIGLLGGIAYGALRLLNRGKKGEAADGVISLNLGPK